VKKSTHSEEYQAVLKMLVALRREAGLTQRGLAKKLKREQSFVWRIESGERRLDVVEFYWVCQALGQDAHRIYGKLAAAFQPHDTLHTPSASSTAKKKSQPKL
jgi:transcriptional regulator with XRE-family HTH domain